MRLLIEDVVFFVSNEDGWVRFINKLYNDSRLIKAWARLGEIGFWNIIH